MVYFDLNVPIPWTPLPSGTGKKGKGKAKANDTANTSSAALSGTSGSSSNVTFTPAQLQAIEGRLDVLVHLGYTVLALTQTVHKKIDPKAQPNILDPLLSKLKPRPGIALLKRLNVVIDEDSEKGFGLTTASSPHLSTYDILSLTPLTLPSLSLACLSHTAPSPITAHIISIPLSLPRLPYHLKNTLVRTARGNGAVFEVCYGGAVGCAGGEAWEGGGIAGGGGTGIGTGGGGGDKSNWWACAREVVRVTKGKGVVVSSGTMRAGDVRAPKDVENLITFLDLSQDAAHDAMSGTPKKVVVRAQTRKTYRAVLSEPKLIIPDESPTSMDVQPASPPPPKTTTAVPQSQTFDAASAPKPAGAQESLGAAAADASADPASAVPPPPHSHSQPALAVETQTQTQRNEKKRPRADSPAKPAPASGGGGDGGHGKEGLGGRKRKKKRGGE